MTWTLGRRCAGPDDEFGHYGQATRRRSDGITEVWPICTCDDADVDELLARLNARQPWQEALVPELLAAAERGDQIIVNMPPQSGSAS